MSAFWQKWRVLLKKHFWQSHRNFFYVEEKEIFINCQPSWLPDEEICLQITLKGTKSYWKTTDLGNEILTKLKFWTINYYFFEIFFWKTFGTFLWGLWTNSHPIPSIRWHPTPSHGLVQVVQFWVLDSADSSKIF